MYYSKILQLINFDDPSFFNGDLGSNDHPRPKPRGSSSLSLVAMIDDNDMVRHFVNEITSKL